MGQSHFLGDMATKVYSAKRKKGNGRVRETTDFFPVTEFFAGSGLVTEALKDSGASFSVDNTDELEP